MFVVNSSARPMQAIAFEFFDRLTGGHIIQPYKATSAYIASIGKPAPLMAPFSPSKGRHASKAVMAVTSTAMRRKGGDASAQFGDLLDKKVQRIEAWLQG